MAETLGKIGGAFTQPFTGDRAAENLFTLAGIAAPRFRIANRNQPWQPGEGEGLRQSLLAMGQFSRSGREEGDTQKTMGALIDAMLGGKELDPSELKKMKPDQVAHFLPKLLEQRKEAERINFLSQPPPSNFLPSTEPVIPGRVSSSLGEFAPIPPNLWKAQRYRDLAARTGDPKIAKEWFDLGNALEMGVDPSKRFEGMRFTDPEGYARLVRQEAQARHVPTPAEAIDQAKLNAIQLIPGAPERVYGYEAAMAKARRETPEEVGARKGAETLADIRARYEELPQLTEIAGAEAGAKVTGEKGALAKTQVYTDEQIAKLRDDQRGLMGQLTTINQALGGFTMGPSGLLIKLLDEPSGKERAKLEQQRDLIEKNYDHIESAISRHELRPPMTLGKRISQQKREAASALASEISKQGKYLTSKEYEKALEDRLKQLGLE